MGRFIDFYAVLNVSNDASREDIRAAYEVRVAELDAPGLSSEERAERRSLLDRTLDILGDEQRRIAYDMTGEGGYEEEPARDEAASVPIAAEKAEEDPYAVLGLGRGASTEEIQEAYAAGIMALGMIKAVEVGPEAMREKTESLSRAYRALMERKRKAARPVSRGWMMISIGAVFATIAATIWNYLALSNPANVPAILVAAPNEASAIAFWTLSWLGCFGLWFLMLFAGFLAANMDADAAAEGLHTAARMLNAMGPRASAFMIGMPMALWIMATDDYTFIIWVAVLFIVILVKERNATRAMLMQVAIVCGHLLFVNYTAWLWAGDTVLKAYVVDGLSSFGFLSWWIVAYGCYEVYVRAARSR